MFVGCLVIVGLAVGGGLRLANATVESFTQVDGWPWLLFTLGGFALGLSASLLPYPGLMILLADAEVRLMRRLDPHGTSVAGFSVSVGLVGFVSAGVPVALLTRAIYLALRTTGVIGILEPGDLALTPWLALFVLLGVGYFFALLRLSRVVARQ